MSSKPVPGHVYEATYTYVCFEGTDESAFQAAELRVDEIFDDDRLILTPVTSGNKKIVLYEGRDEVTAAIAKLVKQGHLPKSYQELMAKKIAARKF